MRTVKTQFVNLSFQEAVKMKELYSRFISSQIRGETPENRKLPMRRGSKAYNFTIFDDESKKCIKMHVEVSKEERKHFLNEHFLLEVGDIAEITKFVVG